MVSQTDTKRWPSPSSRIARHLRSLGYLVRDPSRRRRQLLAPPRRYQVEVQRLLQMILGMFLFLLLYLVVFLDLVQSSDHFAPE